MLKDKDIIVFSDDWGRHPSSCQHLVNRLLQHNRVLWVNTIGMRSPCLSLYDIGRSFEIIGGWLKKGSSVDEVSVPANLRVASPIMVPYNNFAPVRTFNRIWTARKIREIMREDGMERPIVVTTFPCTCDLVGELGESVHVYYCVDDFINWPGVDCLLIGAMEDALIERCDLVLATSDDLCAKKRRSGKEPLLLSHGVDFEHFNGVLGSAKPVEFGTIPAPVIGFFGALSSWLDFDLIAALATARPDWSFVFIGPVDTDITAISGLHNVHLLGRVTYERLPAYAACFDVGIIPFQVNELTKSVNPLKLLEYLACGLPVVSSFMPELRRFADVVSIVDGKEGFLKAIERSLAANDVKERQSRIDVARKQSWQAVADRFSAAVAGKLTSDA